MKKIILTTLLVTLLVSCKKNNAINDTVILKTIATLETPKYATGFSAEVFTTYTIINLKKPYPNATKGFTYLLLNKGTEIPKNTKYDQLVYVPIDKIVVTSTTHIPALEELNVLDKLIGFPNTKYISSKKARILINEGKIKELGKNENINTEILIDIKPNMVMGFGVNGDSKTFSNIQKAGIPVLYNGEWIEQHALGRAEWIKFFGYLFKKEKQANTIFNHIETEYLNAKALAETAKIKPTVLLGSMFKDTWFVPYGNSWASQFISDANGNYLWKNTSGKGSISLNLESILDVAQHANYWITVGNYKTKSELLANNQHYQQFDVFNNNNIYIANKTGETGGLLFFEKAPTRPDLILKDLIKIFHPELLPNYNLYFYQKLN